MESCSVRDSAAALFKGAALTAVFSYLFYRSIAAFFVLIPLTLVLSRRFAGKQRKKEKDRLLFQFKDGILALAASLRAGHSAENAFVDAAEELVLLYGREAPMTKEFRRVAARTGMNVPLEQAVAEMAGRCGLQDIRTFSEVFAAARRTGGELGRMILDTVQTISGRIEVREEIETLLRGRQYEQMVMKMVPVFLLIYMDLTSPGYFSVLYETVFGRSVMTICFALYIGAWFLADRIADIQV